MLPAADRFERRGDVGSAGQAAGDLVGGAWPHALEQQQQAVP
jgi:hypothetical protein